MAGWLAGPLVHPLSTPSWPSGMGEERKIARPCVNQGAWLEAQSSDTVSEMAICHHSKCRTECLHLLCNNKSEQRSHRTPGGFVVLASSALGLHVVLGSRDLVALGFEVLGLWGVDGLGSFGLGSLVVITLKCCAHGRRQNRMNMTGRDSGAQENLQSRRRGAKAI